MEESLMNQQRKRRKKAKKTKITRKPKVPILPNETTLAALRQWMRDSADNVNVKALRLTAKDAKELLDAAWEGNEPRPTPDEIAALLFLSLVVGTKTNEQDSWIHLILTLLSRPAVLHHHINLNIEEGTFQLDERIKVVDMRSGNNT